MAHRLKSRWAMPTLHSGNIERIAIRAADFDAKVGSELFQFRLDSRQHGAFAVGVEGADDGHSRGGGFEGVVVADFAGQKQVCTRGDGVLDQISARPGAYGGAGD